MKITKRQLKRIIKEEKARMLAEDQFRYMNPTGRSGAFATLEELREMGISDEAMLDYLIGNWMSGADALQAMSDFKENEI